MLKNVNNKTLDIKEITLLSADEAKLAEDNIPGILASAGEDWWLRSPGFIDDFAVLVDGFGDVFLDGLPVDFEFGVRPSLRIDNLESNNLQIGDKIQVANHSWTVVSDDLALCDEIIKKEPFNYDKNRGNDYESSHIKEVVNKWGKDMQLVHF